MSDDDDIVTCEICGLQVKSSYFRRHKRRRHPDIFSRKNAQNIICCVCKANFPLRQQFRDHVNETHGKIESQQLKFQSFEEFSSWLQTEENNIKIRFVKNRQPKKLNYGPTRVNYYCQYDNATKNKNIISPEEMKRASKYQGSYKLSGCCPAEMIIDQKRSGQVTVTYYKTHLGHNFSLAHFNLRLEQRKVIAEKLKAGVSFDAILDEARDNLQPDNLKREDFISRKTLHNILQEFKITNYKQNTNPAKTTANIYPWSGEMKNRTHDAICFSKMPGDEDEHLDVNDFCIVIMTKIQAKMLFEFGHRIVCVDGADGKSQCDFKLTTLLVVDNHMQAFPVAHLISNRIDTLAMEVFFESLRTKIGASVTSSIFISDDYAAYFNAWVKAMEPEIPPRRLLCVEHVEKRWHEALANIDCEEGNLENEQNEVYGMLRILLEETDETVFKKTLTIVLNDLMSRKSTHQFAKYFQTNFANRPETWASCYRTEPGVNTNIHTENHLRIIKSISQNASKSKSLDECIDSVLKLIRDIAHERVMKLMHIKAPSTLRKINATHRRSFEISDENVTDRDTYFEIKSQSEGCSYVVKKEHESCPRNCEVICKACNMCQHIYSCTCADFVAAARMCKHIHKVCTLLRLRNIVPASLEPICEIQTTINVNSRLDIIELMPLTPNNNDKNTNDNKLLAQELKNYTEKLTTLLESSQSPVFGVKHLINDAKKILIRYKQIERSPVKKIPSTINEKVKQPNRLEDKSEDDSDIQRVSKKLCSASRKKLDARDVFLREIENNPQIVYIE